MYLVKKVNYKTNPYKYTICFIFVSDLIQFIKKIQLNIV